MCSYILPVYRIASHTKTYGEILSNKLVVNKVIESRAKDFDYIVAT